MAKEDLKGENIGVPEKGPQLFYWPFHRLPNNNLFLCGHWFDKGMCVVESNSLDLNYFPALVKELF